MIKTFTLAHNLTSEVDRATKELYALNEGTDFEHVIIDLSFPLMAKDEIPENITNARLFNSNMLLRIARKHNTPYVKLDNIGVSQNWTQAIELLKPEDGDVIIGVDPDERVQTEGWVQAVATVMQAGGYGLISLGEPGNNAAMLNPEFLKTYKISYNEKTIEGIRVWEMSGITNMALIGLSGKFINKGLGGLMPYPIQVPRYGWIESGLMQNIYEHGGWAVLPDYIVHHTCVSEIYGEWKTWVVQNWQQYGQPDFGTWLRWRKAGKI
jgi:hypothetical protein